MGLNLTINGTAVSLDTPEQFDTLIHFLTLYKTLVIGKTGATTEPMPNAAMSMPGSSMPPTFVQDSLFEQVSPTQALFAPSPVKNNASTRAKVRPPKPPPGQTTADYVIRVLDGATNGLQPETLVQTMVNLGWKTKAVTPYKQRHVVEAMMRRRTSHFVRLSDGAWALVGNRAR